MACVNKYWNYIVYSTECQSFLQIFFWTFKLWDLLLLSYFSQKTVLIKRIDSKRYQNVKTYHSIYVWNWFLKLASYSDLAFRLSCLSLALVKTKGESLLTLVKFSFLYNAGFQILCASFHINCVTSHGLWVKPQVTKWIYFLWIHFFSYRYLAPGTGVFLTLEIRLIVYTRRNSFCILKPLGYTSHCRLKNYLITISSLLLQLTF